jgi:hypothetical protein
MNAIYLHRFRQDAQGTFGLMTMDNTPLCVTCEDLWNGNKNNISCIPEGTYHVTKRISEKYKHHWHVQNVPNRSLILIHNGNTIADTQGCILVGETLATSPLGKQTITNSIRTMNRLREVLPDAFTLIITNPLKG